MRAATPTKTRSLRIPSFDVKYPVLMTNTEARDVDVVVVWRTWTVAVGIVVSLINEFNQFQRNKFQWDSKCEQPFLWYYIEWMLLKLTEQRTSNQRKWIEREI